MFETTLLLATMPALLGVPLADLAACAVVVAFLAAPALADKPKIESGRIIAFGGPKSARTAASHPLDKAPAAAPAPAPARITPAATRLSTADQWQTVSRLVSAGADRMMAVAREQQSIRRELDSLDMTLENMRRELAAVMSVAVPMPRRGQLVAIPVRARSAALAA